MGIRAMIAPFSCTVCTVDTQQRAEEKLRNGRLDPSFKSKNEVENISKKCYNEINT